MSHIIKKAIRRLTLIIAVAEGSDCWSTGGVTGTWVCLHLATSGPVVQQPSLELIWKANASLPPQGQHSPSIYLYCSLSTGTTSEESLKNILIYFYCLCSRPKCMANSLVTFKNHINVWYLADLLIVQQHPISRENAIFLKLSWSRIVKKVIPNAKNANRC